jgi:hypothetical protein
MNDLIYQKLVAYDERTIQNRRRYQAATEIIQVDYWIEHEECYLDDQEEPEGTPGTFEGEAPLMHPVDSVAGPSRDYGLLASNTGGNFLFNDWSGSAGHETSIPWLGGGNLSEKGHDKGPETLELWPEPDELNPLMHLKYPSLLASNTEDVQNVEGTQNTGPDTRLDPSSGIPKDSAVESQCHTAQPQNSRSPPVRESNRDARVNRSLIDASLARYVRLPSPSKETTFSYVLLHSNSSRPSTLLLEISDDLPFTANRETPAMGYTDG